MDNNSPGSPFATGRGDGGTLLTRLASAICGKDLSELFKCLEVSDQVHLTFVTVHPSLDTSCSYEEWALILTTPTEVRVTYSGPRAAVGA